MTKKRDMLLNIVQDVLIEFDENGTYLNIWTSDESLLAKPRAEMLGITITEILPEAESSFYINMIRAIIKSQEKQDINYTTETPKGSVHFSGSLVPLKSEGKKTVILYASDVTEHINLQQAYDDQKHRLDSIIENTAGVVYQCHMTASGQIEFPYISSRILDVYGYTAEEIIENPNIMTKVKYSDDLKVFTTSLMNSAEKLTKLDWIGRITHKDKDLRWVHVQSNPQRLSDESILWDGIILDITERKLRDEEIEAKQKYMNHQLKLASLGELAAGVGHEINNPLAIIQNVLRKISKKATQGRINESEIKHFLDMGTEASVRIAKITEGLRVFSRADSKMNEDFDLRDSIQTTVDLVTELYRHENITIQFLCDEEQFFINANRGRIDQVIMNLLANAKDALQDKDHGSIKVSLKSIEDNCQISVSDNGTGIPDKIRNKIFDHFFTTKEVGKGTGIGLSLVNSIIQEHRGSIDMHSSNLGTTFNITLPLNFKSHK